MFKRLIFQFVVVALIALIAFCFSACTQGEETPPDKRNYLRELEELCAEGQGEGENGWPRLVEAAERYETIAHEWLFERNDAPEEWITGIDYNRIWKNRLTDEERMRYRELIEQVNGAGVFDLMHDALQSQIILRAIPDNISEVVLDSANFEIRELTQVLSISAVIAAWDDDTEAMIMAFDDLQRLANAISLQGGLVNRITALAVATRTTTILSALIVDGEIDGATAKRLLEVERNNPLASYQRTLEAERLIQHVIIAYLYDDERRDDGQSTQEFLEDTALQMARASHLVRDWFSAEGDAPPNFDETAMQEMLAGATFATEQEMHAEIDARFTSLIEDSKRNPWAREITLDMARDIQRDLYPKYLFLCDMIPAAIQSMKSEALAASMSRGVQIMLHLEIHRAEHGAYPERLAALNVPADLAGFTNARFGTPLGYKRIEADQYGRKYILYSYGSDGKDNGGTPSLPNRWDAITGDEPGTDWVFNVPRGS